MLEEGAQMREWNTHEGCPDSIEVEDEWSAGRNHEGADDGFDKTGHGLVAGRINENIVRRFP